MEWYKFELIDGDTGLMNGFTPEELERVTRYVVQNERHFYGAKNYLMISPGEVPCTIDLQDALEGTLALPHYLILTARPPFRPAPGMLACRYLTLVDDKGRDAHHYDLPFDIIGKISTL